MLLKKIEEKQESTFGMTVLNSFATNAEKNSPYYAFKRILARAFNIEKDMFMLSSEPGKLESVLKRKIKTLDEVYLPYAALLATVFGVEAQNNEVEDDENNQKFNLHSAVLQNLLCDVLLSLGKLLIIIDNAE